jgi:hypothetical protein
MNSQNEGRGFFTRGQQGGQIVVEYVLLLAIAVTVALFITTQMVNRSPDSPGFLIKKWSLILASIGADYSDDL